MTRGKMFKTMAAMGIALLMSASYADARAGGGRSSGSRGGNTYSMPRSTPTAPQSGQSFDRSVMPAPSQQPGGFNRPGMPQAAPSAFGMGNIAKGFAIGLLGAGLFGMLTGNGFFSGIGSLMGFLGLLLQLAIVFFVVRWLYRRFVRRDTPVYAGPEPLGRQMGGPLGGMMGGAAGGAGYAGPTASPMNPQGPADQLGTKAQDFDAFEQMLYNVQAAYSSEDINQLRALATPEMVSYFADDLAANQRAGRINRISNVKLLQGDLSEAWREGTDEYATVAMRFSLVDVTLDRASQRVVDGSSQPIQAIELWTFRRKAGGPWQLSAIQQSA